MEQYRIELEHISKWFPGVQALDDVSLKVRPGTVHVLAGENGAGKSTLMKIINGIYKADSGIIKYNGETVNIRTPIFARKLGIAMIFQELNYVPELTVEENIYLGREPTLSGGRFIDKRTITEKTKEFIENEGLHYDPKQKIKELSVSDIQMIEILKAVSGGADLIIMDEPTSAITNAEVEILFRKIEELKKRNISIIYISHRLEEIFRLADDITVMRDGVVVYSGEANTLNEDSLISYMVGRKMENIYPKEMIPLGSERLTVTDFSGAKFKNINLTIRSGEIVCLAGLMGAGRTEFAQALFGMDLNKSGKVEIDGQEVKIASVSDSIKNGLIMVSEDRRKYGLIPCRSLLENIAISSLETRLNRFRMIDKRKELEDVNEMTGQFRIKAPGVEVRVESLSGGNQQKVVLSKCFLTNPKIMILDEPTRGIDIGAKREIYTHMTELAKKGIAILMISSELPEVIGMCDRVYVMSNGIITGELSREQATQESIMKLAVMR